MLRDYLCHKISLNRSGSYIDSSNWIKNKIATIKSINKNYDKCFQYAAAIVLYHKKLIMMHREYKKMNLS